MEKFKKDPYNLNNNLITENDIINIMKSLNITDFQLTNLNFYQTAFIHKSYCKLKDYEEYDYPGGNCIPLQNTSYETMEFLGDAILGSVVSSYLYERFYKLHHQNEGFLTKLKSVLFVVKIYLNYQNIFPFKNILFFPNILKIIVMVEEIVIFSKMYWKLL